MKRRLTRAKNLIVTLFRTLIAFLLAVALPVAAYAQRDDARAQSYAALQAQDVRLGAIADAILKANAPLCRNTMPITGMILHSADQYGDPLEGWFDDGDIAISAIIPGSAAELAGLQPNDAIAAIGGVALSDLAIVEGEPRRDTIFDWIAGSTPQSELDLTYRRKGQEFTARLSPPSGCRVLVEVLADTDRIARSNGKVVQISYGMAAIMNDEELATVFAHELAHAVLEHRRRLSDAGVQSGFFGEFGRNRRLGREVEVEADLLSPHLLANAGYDPAIAAQFWRSDAGREISHGMFRSRRYPSRESRAEAIEGEIAQYLQGLEGLSMPEHLLAKRDLPFED